MDVAFPDPNASRHGAWGSALDLVDGEVGLHRCLTARFHDVLGAQQMARVVGGQVGAAQMTLGTPTIYKHSLLLVDAASNLCLHLGWRKEELLRQ